jgi:hypothetical protein
LNPLFCHSLQNAGGLNYLSLKEAQLLRIMKVLGTSLGDSVLIQDQSLSGALCFLTCFIQIIHFNSFHFLLTSGGSVYQTLPLVGEVLLEGLFVLNQSLCVICQEWAGPGYLSLKKCSNLFP